MVGLLRDERQILTFDQTSLGQMLLVGCADHRRGDELSGNNFCESKTGWKLLMVSAHVVGDELQLGQRQQFNVDQQHVG